ncbi:ABC transporter substrate-binding protein [Aquisalimonas lutea]|uniref:ABC transporter substrate-binding protein n=1 Tax=Aquisalimonas lutea TaxID=1327750 RepID=UPI0025B4F4B0|nr:ABC transporter substrate-binding protein [Aquisalimonas lutea]MDN3518179.1 ABC transporter substrate-binding protein [Aquisalimonas lutea]
MTEFETNCCGTGRPAAGPVEELHVSRGINRRSVLKGMAATAGLSMVSGWSGLAMANDLTKVRLAFCSQLLCVVPYEATRAAGFFAEEGLDVELVYTRGGSAALQALNGGAVDYAATSFDAALNAYANGAEIVRFATTGRLPLFALVTSPETGETITSVSELQGRTIGVAALGTADHALALFLLREAGVDPDTVQFATLGTNLFHALRLGQVDAGMVQEPSLSMLTEQGANLLFNAMDLEDAEAYFGGAYEFMGVSVRRDEREQRMEEMRALARALRKGLAYTREAPVEDLVEALPDELVAGGDIERLKGALSRYRESLYPTEVQIDLDAAQRVVDAQVQAEILESPVDLDAIMDTSILGTS